MLWKEIRGANNFLPYYHPSIIFSVAFLYLFTFLFGCFKSVQINPRMKIQKLSIDDH